MSPQHQESPPAPAVPKSTPSSAVKIATRRPLKAKSPRPNPA